MDPRRLLIFRDVARAGSISAAARELGWTQPAVSQHLRALERSAGCALLLRGAARRRAHRARAGAAGPRRRARGRAAHGSRGARRPDRAAPRAGPAGGVPLGSGHARAAGGRRAAGPPPGRRRRADRGRAARGAGPAQLRATSTWRWSSATTASRRSTGAGLAWRPLGRRAGRPRGRRATTARRTPPARPARPGRGALDRRLRAVPRAHPGAVRRGRVRAQVRHVSDDYVVVQNLVAVGLGVTLLPHSALEAYRHPGVTVREHASFGHPQLGLRAPRGRRAGAGHAPR